MKPFHTAVVIGLLMITLGLGCSWLLMRGNLVMAFSSGTKDDSGHTGEQDIAKAGIEPREDKGLQAGQPEDSAHMRKDVDDLIEDQTVITYRNDRRNHVDCGGGKPLYGGKPVQFVVLKESDGIAGENGIAIERSIDALMLKYGSIIGTTNVQTIRGEHAVSSLRKIPKNDIPSCVWIVDITRFKLSDQDVPALKQYLLDGGMLFTSSESGSGEGEFALFMNRMFPEKKTFKLSHDENVLSQTPFAFPDGPPSVTEKASVSHCYGLRNESRIIAIHYPGDLFAAWNPANTNMTINMRERALEFGINLLHYGHLKD